MRREGRSWGQNQRETGDSEVEEGVGVKRMREQVGGLQVLPYSCSSHDWIVGYVHHFPSMLAKHGSVGWEGV